MINGLSHQMPTLAWKVEAVSAAHSLRKAPSLSQLVAQSQQAKQVKSLNKATALQAQARLTGRRRCCSWHTSCR